eukprot:TRINITY_DN54529_c0_g1_i6.p2 TRINITY_DN54529_c0_g1~~TRINITY_DN54529_c0_g1_i6.p2  ORF type:complete len:279 (-),score=28.94 TRINITY_DN54529_c0_g1_i6:227-1063(-)
MGTTCTFQNWRLELYFKGQQELKSLTNFLNQHNLKRVNITNKKKEDELLNWVRILKQNQNDLDICVHYSIKWNYRGAINPTFQAYQKFLEELSYFQGCSVLLLSGTGPKKRFNSVEALKMMKENGVKSSVPLYVAFNPYLPNDDDLAFEKDRLVQKIKSGLISGIYLQTGSDLSKLREGLEFIQNELIKQDARLSILGSIFVANPRFLAQMRYRPWNGVFLSEEYLSTVENAHQITTKILEVYQEFEVTPIVESPVKSVQDLETARQLLQLHEMNVDV